MMLYDQSENHSPRHRVLEASEMTCVYDKENIQINKPSKNRRHQKLYKDKKNKI
jgi:hypothetical protein